MDEDGVDSDTSTCPSTPTAEMSATCCEEDQNDLLEPQKPKVRRLKGFLSDDESEDHPDEDQIVLPDMYNPAIEEVEIFDDSDCGVRLTPTQWGEWFVASILPQYTETIVVIPMSRVERILASFTTYSELREAMHDSHFEKVFVRLQLEWTYVGGLVCTEFIILHANAECFSTTSS